MSKIGIVIKNTVLEPNQSLYKVLVMNYVSSDFYLLVTYVNPQIVM